MGWIDPVSTALARLNLATYLLEEDFPLLKDTHARTGFTMTLSYAICIGNPASFSTAKLTKLQRNTAASSKGAESFPLL